MCSCSQYQNQCQVQCTVFHIKKDSRKRKWHAVRAEFVGHSQVWTSFYLWLKVFKSYAGISEYVTVTHRDVCQDGFQLDHIADAVFLDLPKPWEVIKSAKQALKLEG